MFRREPYNSASDVFSFGIVLLELASRVLLVFTEVPTTGREHVL